jgi:hypothetical protein
MTLTSYADGWMRSRVDLAERTVDLYRWMTLWWRDQIGR